MIKYGDLATENPELAKEWHPIKNGEVSPDKVSSHSNKKFWWLCSKGHEWYASVNARVGKKSGCPFCKNKRILVGFNDLSTTNPSLAEQWNYEKNLPLTPQDVIKGSGRIVWWIGRCGHEWKASIEKRNSGEGCPICQKAQHTSFPEKSILFYVSQIFDNVKSNYKPTWLKPMEMDIFIPEERIAIEYDGSHWHKDTNKEITKNKKINEKGIKLIRVREAGLPMLDDCICIRAADSLDKTIELVFSEIGKIISKEIVYTGNIERDSIDIINSYDISIKENSLEVLAPDLAKEWHPTKNKALKPINVPYSSHYSVWWKCKKGHEWKAAIYSRFSGIGCPYCSGRKALSGFNDLKTMKPELAKEWAYDKNNSLLPENETVYSNKKVWWRCKLGHEWQATINSRSSGRGCPVCANKVLLVGVNDLATMYPDIANQWNKEKNHGLTAQMVTYGTHQKVWWKCGKGHEWQAEVRSRVKGFGCPYCTNMKVLLGYNDLKTTNSDLISEWDNDKNGLLSPEDFSAGSGIIVWWKCSKGHEWQARIYDRTSGSGCPICSNQKIISGINDLATIDPGLAEEWNEDKNGELTPEMVSASSSKKVWWKCKKGHEWKTSIANRKNGTACPYCSGNKLLTGYNDLKTIYPDLADEWNYEKNGDLLPEMVTAHSPKKVWWKGKCGHEWQAIIGNRTKGSGCIYCSRQKALVGFSDLKTTNPELAVEWDYDKNTDINIETVMAGSHKKVWWRCSKGHEWQAAVYSRSSGTGCPFCKKTKEGK